MKLTSKAYHIERTVMENRHESPIRTYNVALAMKHGIREAVILDILHTLTEAPNAVVRDGRRWVTISVRELAEICFGLTEPQMRRILKNLEKGGLILAEINNLDPYNRTKSYTLTNKANAYFIEGSGAQ